MKAHTRRAESNATQVRARAFGQPARDVLRAEPSDATASTYADDGPMGIAADSVQALADRSPQTQAPTQLAALIEGSSYAVAQRQRLVAIDKAVAQRRGAERRTGLPDDLRTGIESLSGLSMDGVRVHYGSPEPAQLDALAFARGNEIHVGPGQERHLPHEAWHVVQQAQGRVRPTLQLHEGVPVNDDAGLEREADVMGARALSGTASVKDSPAQRETRQAQSEPRPVDGGAAAGAGVVQRERFIGVRSGHHLHVEIHQDHYKSARDDGSRIEIGKNGNYKLDQLIVARNYLVNNDYTDNGGQACIDWLEAECQTHADWDEGVGYTPSWEVEEAEDNPHVDTIFENAAAFGYGRADFENSLIQAQNDVLEEESEHLAGGNHYPEDTSAADLSEVIDEVTLPKLLASWSGFPDDLYSKEAMAEHFKRAAKDYLRMLLQDELPLNYDKYEYLGGLEG